jgi:hypothetical protein
MTPYTDDEGKSTQSVGVTIGFKWLADLKLRFGRWLEERRNKRYDGNQGGTVYTGGFVWLAELKARFGKWLEERGYNTR